MSKGQVNLQDIFLNQVRKERVGVTVYLTGGVQLRGMVRGFDAFTVLLDTPGKAPQIVYKHAIASIVPAKQINISTGDFSHVEHTGEETEQEESA